MEVFFFFLHVNHISIKLLKIKNFFFAKEPIKGLKRQATDWEKIFADHTSDKGLLSRIHKELSKIHSKKKTNNPIRKWVKDMDRHFTKEDTCAWQINTLHSWAFIQERWSYVCIETCIKLFIAALVGIGQNRKQPYVLQWVNG